MRLRLAAPCCSIGPGLQLLSATEPAHACGRGCDSGAARQAALRATLPCVYCYLWSSWLSPTDETMMLMLLIGCPTRLNATQCDESWAYSGGRDQRLMHFFLGWTGQHLLLAVHTSPCILSFDTWLDGVFANVLGAVLCIYARGLILVMVLGSSHRAERKLQQSCG
jgi:hypothetical protein